MFGKKRIRLPNGVRLKISRHFHYDQFGVRGRYETVSSTGLYVNSREPGTGFFVHGTDSRSYRQFVRTEKAKLEQNFRTRLFRKEPSFRKEIAKVEKLLDKGQLDGVRKQVVSQYLNVLRLAQEAELDQRIVRGIKDKIGNNRPGRKQEKNTMYTSILANYKSRIATLQHDAKGIQLNIKDTLSPEALEKWHKVVETFTEMAEVRRLWHVVNGESFEQVFFDLGIFDYIQSPFDTPVMRDAQGGRYYLYPQGIIAARTNMDFDFLPFSEIDFEGNMVDLNTLYAQKTHRRTRKRHTDPMSTLFATTAHGSNAVGQLNCKALNLTFYCNHVKPVVHFAQAYKEFKQRATKKDFSLSANNH